MKAMLEQEVTLDRISTREELCEVMELLCRAGKSEFTRKTEKSEPGKTADVALHYDEGSKYVIRDEGPELVSEEEMSSLTELLLGQLDRPN